MSRFRSGRNPHHDLAGGAVQHAAGGHRDTQGADGQPVDLGDDGRGGDGVHAHQPDWPAFEERAQTCAGEATVVFISEFLFSVVVVLVAVWSEPAGGGLDTTAGENPGEMLRAGVEGRAPGPTDG